MRWIVYLLAFNAIVFAWLHFGRYRRLPPERREAPPNNLARTAGSDS